MYGSCDQKYQLSRKFKIIKTIVLTPESGYLCTPLGTSSAILAAAVLRIVSTNTRQDSSSRFLQALGQPRMIVFGFIPPRPAPWILKKKGAKSLQKQP